MMTYPVNCDVECWHVPQAPFQILYSRLVLEQIRLAVVDAYFVVPHGGVEIGGILLGKYAGRQVEVIDHEPVECEYVFGPSFSLSPRDEERLKDVLAEVRNKSDGLEPVGWYLSHTRSEIFLTEADLAIHDRYFPGMWQVALVVRPSTTEPTRAGFFFRELDGSIHASASYHEFQLEPLRRGTALAENEADAADPLAPQTPLEGPNALAIDPQPKLKPQGSPLADAAPLPKRPPAATPNPQPAPAPSAVSAPVRRVDSGSQLIELPRFLRNEPPPHAEWTRVPVFVIGMVCLAFALGGLAYVARDAVLPWISGIAGRVSSSGGPVPEIGPAMTIKAIDDQEFQIRWDIGSPAIQGALSAVLAIVDGGVAERIPLDAAHLQAGAFTFRKHSARMDFKLTIVTAEGSVEAATTFLGPLSMAVGEPASANAGSVTLATQNVQLRRQLDEQVARNKTLQVRLDRLRQKRATDAVP
jgi:proteasome lid subunit RPN8/RPN11